ncbi:hypothetical protein D4764_01G0007650 [Takifugu flavidus]|uniref:Uncharacterized protein n=1 Tax=Takifugu flavidus TaxID=433684 RepID=A0A5C6PRQ4_9TELE|nr:hypothetical protein D4764_01G0007650 [Takifugu flavidus]
MHSDFVSLRNSMFHLNPAALLFILQLFMWKVFAGDHRTTDENNQKYREQEEESLRGEAQFNLRSIGLQNRTAL